ncbi:hypothetical protein ACFVGN_39615 [Streptomyces sp. NPDC057757]|uniref:hypothetical protein n=1 Tax=Streptomyces sp. NPDC057757 TaxID=3346241 RepID=UPI00368E5B35
MTVTGIIDTHRHVIAEVALLAVHPGLYLKPTHRDLEPPRELGSEAVEQSLPELVEPARAVPAGHGS